MSCACTAGVPSASVMELPGLMCTDCEPLLLLTTLWNVLEELLWPPWEALTPECMCPP